MRHYLRNVTATFNWGLLVVLSACSATPVGHAGGNGAGGGGEINGGGGGQGGSLIDNLPDAGTTPGDPTPTVDANCGLLSVESTKLPADLLLLLDRSNSMVNDIAGATSCEGVAGCTSRWQAVTTAIDAVLPASQDSANWGLKLFATSNNGCDVADRVDVAPAPGSAGAIGEAIGATGPSTGTPTTAVVTWAANYLANLKDDNPKYILLATDGQPYCGGRNKDQPDDEAAIAAIAAAAKQGIPVFVVGIAIDDTTRDTLNKMAEAGGVPRNSLDDPDKFYPANSPEKLQAALATISRAAASCSFKLAKAPSAGQFIAVYADGALVKEGEGWSYDSAAQSVEISGASCDAVKGGITKKVDVVFSCTRIVQ